MLLGIQLSLVLLFLCSSTCYGDPTFLLNAAPPGLGGVYGMGGGLHAPMLFDRDDVDIMLGPAMYNSPMLPPAMPMMAPARSPGIVVLDRNSPGITNVINNEMAPIPGVRYVVPRRRSAPSRSYYRRRNSYRRRFGRYG